MSEYKNLSAILEGFGVPELLSKDEMLDILFKEEYGYMPPAPSAISWRVEEDIIPKFCAGKAVENKITADCVINGKKFSFPFYSVIPTKKGKYPFFVHINFRDSIPDRYMPTEELVDNGFAVLSFCYNDVVGDDGDFEDGLAKILFENGKRQPDSPGKIAMWAWAAHRVMDFAQTLGDVLDLERGTVCGHSRLGKTALLAAATDERFRFAYSNDSGCSGASITRGKRGEHVVDICKRFPFWFCENYNKYSDNEDNMPFDQHYLVASIAPRFVCIGSADEDVWADPNSEMLACVAASSAYETIGKDGFIAEDRLPQTNDKFFDGSIGYHLRKGLHYFSREDWLRLIEFIKKH